ncbi:hypothetical protein Tco_0867157 [Tanacetum coccineum]
MFDFILVTRAQTKTTIDSFQNKLRDTMCENAKLRAQLFDKVSEQKDTTKGTSVNTQFCKQSILGKPPSSSKPKLYVVTPFPKSKGLPKIDKTHALSKPVTSNSIPTPQESKVVNNDKVIAPGMFRINPFKPSREDKYVPNKVRASVRTNPITVSQPHVITKKDVNSDSNGLSSTGVDNTAKTRRPQPRSNTKNDRVPSASKSSCSKNKEVEVEEHPRNLLLSKNKKHMSSECNNIKLAIRNDKSDPAKPPQIITTNTLSNIKLPVLQKDDYDTWAMEMEHYLEYIDNEVWKVIQNGNSKKRVTKGKDGVYRVLPPTTQEEQVADEKERKARTLLLMAVPKDHLRRFHGMDDAKEIWAAIKTRFGGNANSKKMQKAVLKQQFEAFTISSRIV